MIKKVFFIFFLLSVISCKKDPIPVIYTLTTHANPSNGGTVSPKSQQYAEGSKVNITATASSEYLFQSWSGATGSSNTTKVIMNSDKSVTANFVKKRPVSSKSILKLLDILLSLSSIKLISSFENLFKT